MSVTMVYAGLTDVGRMRETNEDAFGIDPQLGLMVVADGLGGHPAGEVASAFVVEALPRQLAMGRAAGLEDAQGPAQLLSQSLLIVAEQLRDMGCATPEQEGMGATVVAALVSDAALLVAHLGDSRAYRLRNGHLELLTRDHNLGNALRDEGVVHDGAEDIPEYHVLRRFVGMDQPLPPDVGAFDLRQRDRYLLCSDGLTNMLDEGEIAEVLRAETPCEQICRQMVSRANEAGGYDNITVIVAEVQSVRADHVSPSKVAQTIASLDLEESPLLHETSEKG
ncbi:MAG: protein phosphatase 2C domain-containing protein [Sedimentisphaerales bacterium]|jgi:protein phosphatase|nr:protein phosphatase 2C domain-containing protein [Sedimentisphaerales bacterium]HNY79814.1 protein phosphatase 2C domain-containing protein [Sedimentisphaerales bacterium]HOC64816.1 protein phosphatase 2C domain-containing protein [Sedimentisphaerales bacterium]HOH65746.1 protein phosphatase 2C domain-containing protein [Sedimentisphaerales bacterium]HQA89130.1 protein phosphatase 2C domain-containing protein [Sedimentisphaerales bacterium]